MSCHHLQRRRDPCPSGLCSTLAMTSQPTRLASSLPPTVCTTPSPWPSRWHPLQTDLGSPQRRSLVPRRCLAARCLSLVTRWWCSHDSGDSSFWTSFRASCAPQTPSAKRGSVKCSFVLQRMASGSTIQTMQQKSWHQAGLPHPNSRRGKLQTVFSTFQSLEVRVLHAALAHYHDVSKPLSPTVVECLIICIVSKVTCCTPEVACVGLPVSSHLL
jgi:hypothetical protein